MAPRIELKNLVTEVTCGKNKSLEEVKSVNTDGNSELREDAFSDLASRLNILKEFNRDEYAVKKNTTDMLIVPDQS